MRRHSDSSESHSDSYTEVISMESFARGHMWFSLFFLSSSFTLGRRTREISTAHWNPKLWLVLGINVNFERLSSLKRSSAIWRECWGLVSILKELLILQTWYPWSSRLLSLDWEAPWEFENHNSTQGLLFHCFLWATAASQQPFQDKSVPLIPWTGFVCEFVSHASLLVSFKQIQETWIYFQSITFSQELPEDAV